MFCHPFFVTLEKKSELPPDTTDNESVFSDADDSVVDSVVSHSTVNSLPQQQKVVEPTTTAPTPPTTTTTTAPSSPPQPPPSSHNEPEQSDSDNDSHDQVDHAEGTNSFTSFIVVVYISA